MPSREDQIRAAYAEWKSSRRHARKVASKAGTSEDFAVQLIALYDVADQTLWQVVREAINAGVGRKQIVLWCGDNRDLYAVFKREEERDV